MSEPAHKMAVHFSSATDDWATPQDLYDKLNAEFGFDLDVACTSENCKAPTGILADLGRDGLTEWWGRRNWMNPPYGRGIGKWVHKAAQEAINGALVVALLPARTDTAWWHDNIWDESKNAPHPWVREIRFLRGRLKFGKATNSAPFPSAVVVFDGRQA